MTYQDLIETIIFLPKHISHVYYLCHDGTEEIRKAKICFRDEWKGKSVGRPPQVIHDEAVAEIIVHLAGSYGIAASQEPDESQYLEL